LCQDDLAEGRIRAVTATSALELGVDIGGLDATVLCGFPSTIASFWQQIGRAGRSGQESLAVLVAGTDQLDQWFATHPKDLFERPPEPAVINVDNPNIMDPHLTCAAYEQPLRHADDAWWTELDEGVRRLVLDDELKLRPDPRNVPRAFWSGRGIPLNTISLRSASGGEVRIPPQELDTTAIWYEWQQDVIDQAGVTFFNLPGALHAAEHAAIGILPLFTICDRWDVGGVSIAAAPQSGLPTVFIYDGYPGGAGVADLAYAAADRHLASTADLLEACPCSTGCPSCVQSPKCGNGNEPLHKQGALALLRTTLGPADPF